MKLGATRRFPDGCSEPGDEGELSLAVSSGVRLVRIDFGKPVAWFSMLPEMADALADALRNHAARVRANKN